MFFKETLQKQSREGKPARSLSLEEVSRAEEIVIRHVQQTSFHEEMKVLEKNASGSGNVQPLKSSSAIYRLNPKLDKGILRVGGRLSRSAMPEESKHQVILPKKHPIVLSYNRFMRTKVTLGETI